MTTSLSVIILAKNEEDYIAWCINSVRWADEVLVVDSGSTDRTRELAASLGANVYEQEWLGWPGQRNKGVSLAKNDWVFFIEADEIVSAELAASIQRAFAGTVDERDGYSLDRRGDFLGVLIPNEARASKRLNFVRIFNRKHSVYDMSMKVHEEVIFPGKAIPLEGVLLHWRGYKMDELVAVFNRYATVEAEVLNKKGKQATALSILGWPILHFFWSYLAKGGWRLGTRGLMHVMLKASSDYMRYAKLWELQNVTRSPHPPADLYQPPADGIPAPVTPALETGSIRVYHAQFFRALERSCWFSVREYFQFRARLLLTFLSTLPGRVAQRSNKLRAKSETAG